MFESTDVQPAVATVNFGLFDVGRPHDAPKADARESFSMARRIYPCNESRPSIAPHCRKRWSYYVFRQGIRMLLEVSCR
jgi:hypothetical protein